MSGFHPDQVLHWCNQTPPVPGIHRVASAAPGTLGKELTTDAQDLRAEFERLAGRDAFGLKRSRKGTYVNPAIARDWKWFQLGAEHAPELVAALQPFVKRNSSEASITITVSTADVTRARAAIAKSLKGGAA